MQRWIFLGALLAGISLPADQSAESRALVQRLVLDRAAAVASVQRIADEREEQLFADLAAKDRRLRAERSTRAWPAGARRCSGVGGRLA